MVRNLLEVERCDRCTARALVAVAKGELEVLFCGHHAGQHVRAVLAQGFEVTANNTGTSVLPMPKQRQEATP